MSVEKAKRQLRLPYFEEIAVYDLFWLIEVFKFKEDLIVLASTMFTEEDGRYSFIGFDSFNSFSAKGKHFYWNKKIISLKDPFLFLQEKMAAYSLSPNKGLPPFQGGVAGYFGYECAHYIEKLPTVSDPIKLPDIYLNFYSSLIAIDHLLNQSWIIATGFPEIKEDARKNKAEKDILKIKKIIKNYEVVNRISLKKTKPFKPTKTAEEEKSLHPSLKMNPSIISNLDLSAYMRTVEKTKEYIKAGDIFQANISQQFQTLLNDNLDILVLYKHLMRVNPAPYSAFIKVLKNGYIVSASPERFIKISEGKVITCPIKGTIGRSSDLNIDKQLSQTLVNSEKDRAENIMIVDLMRNDLSRVSIPGTVVVEELCELKQYPTVQHLVSKISASLKKNYDAWDVLKASFPPGSITGAPKIRAMEIISELEHQSRGPYCGSIGYISFTGEMDTSVTIRSFYIKDEKVFFSAGGAIVLDSNPEAEYFESLTKAKALLEMFNFDTD